jgi:NTE family protein
MTATGPRVGLVLGGGGIVGQAYHGAVLAALHEATGWDPRDAEVVVGTSAGAASGAELRAGLSGADMAARRDGSDFSAEGEALLRALGAPPQTPAHDVEVDEERARASFRRLLGRAMMWPAAARPGVLISVAMSPGRLSASWLTHQVHWLLGGDAWPERELWSCAIDLDRGTRVVFGREDAPPARPGPAVEASCAIPGVFAPVAIGDGLYVDGGGWSPSNADVLADRGLDLVIVVSPMTAVPGTASDRGDARTRTACRRMLEDEARRLRARGTAVAIVEPGADDLRCMGTLIGFDVLDESRCSATVDQVRASTAARVRAGSIDGLGLLGRPPLATAA